MPNKNSLANKKRKKIKFDATSGSISGYLLASSESVDVNNSSDNSLDASEVNAISTVSKARLSTELDESFDLFKNKKFCKKSGDNLLRGVTSPTKTLVSSPVKTSPRKVPSPSKSAKSPKAKDRKTKTVKKCDYFAKSPSLSVPCPFCFKFEEDIFSHISTNCIRPPCVTDETVSELIEIHTDYWNQRRNLGVPDITLNEDEIFKNSVQLQKLRDTGSESSSDYKIPTLKWTSKSKKSKHLLLRQNRTERENKITQKLAILLMGNEAKNHVEKFDDIFSEADKVVESEYLCTLLSKEPTMWEKSSIQPDHVTEDTYYVKALAPFIAPFSKNKASSPLPSDTHKNQETEDGDAEVADIFSSVDSPVRTDSCFVPLQVKSSPDHKSEMKDSCFTETDVSESRDNDINNRCQPLLSKNWEKMFDSSDLSDTIVVFRDGSLFCHSLVIYANSIKVFKSISSCSYKESGKILDLKDISSTAGRAFIKYIYTGEVHHFKTIDNSDLELIRILCENYDEFRLMSFIKNIINFRNSESCLENGNRNVGSPDIFEDSDSDHNCLNTTYSISRKIESTDSSASSKRKLELSPRCEENENELSKRSKTDFTNTDSVFDALLNKNNDNRDSQGDSKNPKLNIDNDDIVSISSDGAPSISSATTMSPGRYEKLMARPLSQCSTLPPLSESPKLPEEKLASPLTELDRLSNNGENDAENPDSNEMKENCSQTPEYSRYYDNDIFDYNEYMGTSIQDEPQHSFEFINAETNSDGENSVIKSGKNSLDKYFDDSIPDFIESPVTRCRTPQTSESNARDSPPSKGLCQSTPTQSLTTTPKQPLISNDITTPSSQIIISDKVTPMLNYSNLISPELKTQLCKYGLKPDMDRKKAKTLLRYIYDLVHPIIPQDNDDNPLNTDLPDNRNARNDDIVSQLNENDSEENRENKADTSSESLLVNDSEENSAEYDFECAQDSPCTQEQSSYLIKSELVEVVSEFIKKDAVLFESILMYVPVWLSKFHQALREKGIKCTKNDLMDALDELCITFRTEKKPPKEKTKRKRS